MKSGHILALILLLCGLSSSGLAGAARSTLALDWADLRNGGETSSAAAGNEPADATTLSWGLRGKPVRIAGYVLPSDREGDLVYQFLLIPWGGLCAHVPPPPANQAILITLKQPYKLREIYEIVAVTGTLEPELEKTQLFILDGISVIESGYRIAGAQIEPAEHVTGAARQPKSNPWGFVAK